MKAGLAVEGEILNHVNEGRYWTVGEWQQLGQVGGQPKDCIPNKQVYVKVETKWPRRGTVKESGPYTFHKNN